MDPQMMDDDRGRFKDFQEQFNNLRTYNNQVRNAVAELSERSLTGTLQEYFDPFQSLLVDEWFDEELAISLFLGGLNEDIRKSVRIFEPRTLDVACALTRLQELVHSVPHNPFSYNTSPQRTIERTPQEHQREIVTIVFPGYENGEQDDCAVDMKSQKEEQSLVVTSETHSHFLPESDEGQELDVIDLKISGTKCEVGVGSIKVSEADFSDEDYGNNRFDDKSELPMAIGGVLNAKEVVISTNKDASDTPKPDSSAVCKNEAVGNSLLLDVTVKLIRDSSGEPAYLQREQEEAVIEVETGFCDSFYPKGHVTVPRLASFQKSKLVFPFIIDLFQLEATTEQAALWVKRVFMGPKNSWFLIPSATVHNAKKFSTTDRSWVFFDGGSYRINGFQLELRRLDFSVESLSLGRYRGTRFKRIGHSGSPKSSEEDLGVIRGGVGWSGVKPLQIIQSEGPRFRLNGHFVKWQKWKFKVGFIPSEGLVVYSKAYLDGRQGRRSATYQRSLVKRALPCGDPDETHYQKKASDSGQNGLGKRKESEFGIEALQARSATYIHFCNQAGVHAENRFLAMRDIGKRFVDLLEQCIVSKLVIGAATSIHFLETLTELKSTRTTIGATVNFEPSMRIGKDGYWSIYRGFTHRMQVVMKMLQYDCPHAPLQFHKEFCVVTKLRQPNLVSLIESVMKLCSCT